MEKIAIGIAGGDSCAQNSRKSIYFSATTALMQAIKPASRALEVLEKAPFIGDDLALLPAFGCVGAFEVQILCHSGQCAPSTSQKRRANRILKFWRGAGLDVRCIRAFHQLGLDHE